MTGQDPRLEAVARAEWAQANGEPWRRWDGRGEAAIWRESAAVILAAADAADRAAGYVRVAHHD